MFSILIPTLNNLNYLKLCIKSIKNNSKYNHEIIVHVNECHKDTNNGKGLRIFQYAKGLAYFTTVVKEPKVQELTNEWKKGKKNKKTRKPTGA